MLLVDDLITRADSKKEAITAIGEAGMVVLNVLVLVDRQQGGADELRAIGKSCHALFTIRQLLSFYRTEKLIVDEIYEECMAYLDA